MQSLLKCLHSHLITNNLHFHTAKRVYLKRGVLISSNVANRSYNSQPNNIVNLKVPRKNSFNINDLIEHVHKGKVFYLKQLKNVFHTIEFDKLQPDDASLLLKLCGSVVVDSSCEQRNEICQEIFKKLQEANNLNSDILNRYIKTCTENGILTFSEELLRRYLDESSYSLLLENVCQFGRIEEALSILEAMKNKGLSLGSDNINSLVLAHTINGGMESGESVLNTIKTAKISETNSAKLALYKGLIRRGDIVEFKKGIELYPFKLESKDLLVLIEELGLRGLESWLNDLYPQYKHLPIPQEQQNDIEKICIHLIHMEQPESAMNIYEKFIKPQADIHYGYALLKEMLHCNIDMSVILGIAKRLKEGGLNEFILEELTWLTLKFKYEEQTWELLNNLNVLRPHYFWPLLVHSAHTKGEQGIFSTLSRIQNYDVKLDSETLEYYILPHCNLTKLKFLVLKLQEVGFNVGEILSPMLTILLKSNKTKWASELCSQYKGNISGSGFLQQLAKSWVSTKDSVSTVNLLARYCESNPSVQDLVGTFLVQAAKFCERADTLKEYLRLVLLISRQRLRMTSYSAELIQDICRPFLSSNSNLQKDFENKVNSLVDFGMNLSEDCLIPHPRNMDLGSLESHLVELRAKNMEIRGVLRKLILMHAAKGNVQRVKELRQLFLDSGYKESPGIKSSIMHSLTRAGCLDEALSLYDEFKAVHSNFSLDTFKFIDLVRLLISNDRFDEGFNILQEEAKNCKKVGSIRAIERNCKELLDACKNADEVNKIFNILLQYGLCVATNVTLGPLVKIHLKSGDTNEAIRQYLELSKKYKCTPLQLEVLREAAKRENVSGLEQVYKATEAVHGVGPAQIGLIAALAENGQENALRKTLIGLTNSIQGLLQRRCSRWVQERKIEPLMCLAKVSRRLSQQFVDTDFVHKSILEIYDLNGDSNGAAAFISSLPEEGRTVTLEEKVKKMCKASKVANRS